MNEGAIVRFTETVQAPEAARLEYPGPGMGLPIDDA